MVKVNEALRIILELITPLSYEEVKLFCCLDRVLAEDIYAEIDVPQLDNSAMDGYALRSDDTREASRNNPKNFEIIETVRAGFLPTRKVGKQQATKIMTGAPMPDGADSVVMVENTEKEGKAKVKIFKEVNWGDNVRRKGEDIKEGELVIKKGAVITSAHIGILASLGRAKVKVTRKPRVAVVVTGDEVVDIEDEFKKGKLRSSNTYTLYSQIIKAGGVPENLGIVPDEPFRLEERIAKGLDCDLILTSGGVSVGEYDLVKFILARMGTEIKFWKVAMKPGKPLVFGLIKGKPIFGLPGNPVSSMISFEVFVKPAILKMLGRLDDDYKEVDAVLEEDLKKKTGMRYFLRARTRWEDGVYFTHTTGPQGSAILKSMALANSLIILPEEEEYVEKGRRVRVRFLS
jgi:molybdopterin molybdotransferase